MIRRLDVAAVVVVGTVLVLLGALAVWQSAELRGVTAERNQLQRVVDYVGDQCARHEDGSAECQAGTWPTVAKGAAGSQLSLAASFGAFAGSTASRVRGSGTHVEQSAYGAERTATLQQK